MFDLLLVKQLKQFDTLSFEQNSQTTSIIFETNLFLNNLNLIFFNSFHFISRYLEIPLRNNDDHAVSHIQAAVFVLMDILVTPFVSVLANVQGFP